MPRHARQAAIGVVGLGVALLFALPGVAAPPSVIRAQSRAAARSSANHEADRAPLTRDDIRHAEERLADLGYWVGPVDGVLDPVSRQAVVAFQKIAGLKATGRLSRTGLAALDRAVPPLPRERGPAHVEVDLARQVLFLVDGQGKVGNILPVSTGTGKPFREQGYSGVADTPCGHLEVFSKLSGWKKSPLGEMYNPLYVVGGIAIHGSLDVPPHPASHGCIRVPMFASHRLPAMIPLKTPVLVYGCKVDDLQPLTPIVAAAGPSLPAAPQPAETLAPAADGQPSG
jgi:N-acetylmuramoyl-L-alanine amidase